MPSDPLDPLYDRKARQEREAWEKVDDSFPLKPANELKAWIAGQAHALQQAPLLASEREQALTLLLDQARERFDSYVEDVQKRFGSSSRAELGDLPVSEEDHRAFERAMTRIGTESGEERWEVLRDELVKAATPTERSGPNLAVLQELRDVLERELKKFPQRHQDGSAALPDAHPLEDARRAVDLATQTVQTHQAERADDYLHRVTTELEGVLETVRQTGEWGGPRARARRGDGRDFRFLDPIGEEETSYRRGSSPSEATLTAWKKARQAPDRSLLEAAREAAAEPQAPEGGEPDPRERFLTGSGERVQDVLAEAEGGGS